MSQQLNTSNNLNSINKIFLDSHNKINDLSFENNISFINKNNFYLFNDNLLDFNNKLKLKKTN